MTTQPLTRDLAETIRALEVSEAELLFQADRLARVVPSTDDEISHLADLRDGYREAAKYQRILINYHKGRTGRQPAARDPAVDARGHAAAHTENGE